MTPLRCALALTGGVAKGAFHAGVLKALAETPIVPSVVVGSSAGALNGALCAKLIATDTFTPRNIDEQLVRVWLEEASISKLWGKGEINDRSLRSLVGDTQLSIYMLRRLVPLFVNRNLGRLRELLSLNFVSLLSDKHLIELIDYFLPSPEQIVREVFFAAAVTHLTGEMEFYAQQPIINHGDYVSFHLHPGLDPFELQTLFKQIKKVIRASASFPGMFPPVPLEMNGSFDYYIDGGLTKNGPFGRAIKLDPTVRTIFLVSSMPITKPAFEQVDDFLTVIGQLYKIILNKDLSNDYRKIFQINQKIERVEKLLKRGPDGKMLRHSEFNEAVLQAAGFHDLDDFLSQRVVEIVIIEPAGVLEGDPFAGLYKKDRVRLMQSYTDMGYQAGKQAFTQYLAQTAQ